MLYRRYLKELNFDENMSILLNYHLRIGWLCAIITIKYIIRWGIVYSSLKPSIFLVFLQRFNHSKYHLKERIK